MRAHRTPANALSKSEWIRNGINCVQTNSRSIDQSHFHFTRFFCLFCPFQQFLAFGRCVLECSSMNCGCESFCCNLNLPIWINNCVNWISHQLQPSNSLQRANSPNGIVDWNEINSCSISITNFFSFPNRFVDKIDILLLSTSELRLDCELAADTVSTKTHLLFDVKSSRSTGAHAHAYSKVSVMNAQVATHTHTQTDFPQKLLFVQT